MVFIIDEGRVYRLRSLQIEGIGTTGDSPLKVFSDEQVVALSRIRPGDVVTRPAIEKTQETIRNAYLQMGYLDVRVVTRSIRTSDSAEVDLFVQIDEGMTFQAGLVLIQGNFITKDKVIRRLVRVLPGRTLNGATLEIAEQRLKNSQLFNDVRITIQQPNEDEPEVRDVIVEIKEKNTGSFNFGVGFGSDAGIFGEFSMKQTNFDIADFPLSVDELISGRAFRGAGQGFDLTLAPGNEIQSYSVNITEPHLFETDNSGRVGFAYRRRVYFQYDEDRISSSFTLGRRLGDIWVGSVSTTLQRVQLKNFDGSTPLVVAADAGPDLFTSLGVSLQRSTINNMFRPSQGSVLNVGFQKYFSIQGNVDFWEFNAGVTSFLTLYEDFLGRRQILRLKTNFAYIFGGNAPTYERFFLGGRTMRGFQFRTVSPKSSKTLGDPSGVNGTPEPVGGTWEFFAGAQYELPVFGESLALVAFMDSGTVTDTPGFDDYRISLGVGIRLYIPQLGPAPLAFDFGFPILYQSDDELEMFSFTAALPF